MAEPTIKARLELVTSSGVSGAEALTQKTGELSKTVTERRGALGSSLGGIGGILGGVGSSVLLLNALAKATGGGGIKQNQEEFEKRIQERQAEKLQEETETRDENTQTIAEHTGVTVAQVEAMGLSNKELNDYAKFLEQGQEGIDKMTKTVDTAKWAMDRVPKPVQDMIDKFREVGEALGLFQQKLNNMKVSEVPRARLRSYDTGAKGNLEIIDAASSLINRDIVNSEMINFTNINSRGVKNK